jgi:hypothetical protein
LARASACLSIIRSRIVPAIVFAAWGWHLVAKREVGPAWLRLILLPPALLLLAAACAALPTPDSWPLRASLWPGQVRSA